MPDPFGRGDIVRVCGTEDCVGVARDTKEQMEAFEKAWKRGEPLAACADYGDISVKVDLLADNGDFDHDHLSPFRLECIDKKSAPKVTDEQWELLQTAQELYRGVGSLEMLALLQWPFRQGRPSLDVSPLKDFLWVRRPDETNYTTTAVHVLPEGNACTAVVHYVVSEPEREFPFRVLFCV